MAIGEVYRASVVGSHSGTELAVCTFHFRMLSEAAPDTTIGLYLKTYWCDLVKTRQNSEFRWDRINLLRVNASPPVSYEYTTGFPVAGTTGDLPLARQTACVVTTKTGYAGRSYRGRHYIPALGSNQISSALWAAATVSALQTYYDDMVAAVGASGANTDIRWVVWSYKLLTYTDITDTIVRNNPAVIRRRRIGVGQ